MNIKTKSILSSVAFFVLLYAIYQFYLATQRASSPTETPGLVIWGILLLVAIGAVGAARHYYTNIQGKGTVKGAELGAELSAYGIMADDYTKSVSNMSQSVSDNVQETSVDILVENPTENLKQIIISVKDIVKEYKIGQHKVRALNGVTFDVYKGEFLALVGSSGSGKSTLLQLLDGLEKPTSGTITIDGVNLNTLSDSKLSRFRGQFIGFVFQFFYLQPFLKLGRNIEVPGMFAHMNRAERKQKVLQLAQSVGIADRLDHYPKELSGGQIQRAAIVRALLNNPKIILADEPTGNLDSQNGAAIIDLFDDIRRKFGTTIIVATHDMGVAQRADRVINLKDGALL
jgi:ABC-type lipoprotein export system ATPase subunit